MTQHNSIKSISDWFTALNRPQTGRALSVQIGVHVEEFVEGLMALGPDFNGHASSINKLATYLKTEGVLDETTIQRKELLDGLADLIVTSIGVAGLLRMDIGEALARVDRSNWSKFVDGVPIFDDNGKAKKGPSYVPPNLEGLY